jgi:hypothetical protein
MGVLLDEPWGVLLCSIKARLLVHIYIYYYYMLNTNIYIHTVYNFITIFIYIQHIYIFAVYIYMLYIYICCIYIYMLYIYIYYVCVSTPVSKVFTFLFCRGG